MTLSPTKSARDNPVKQFSIFTENKVGRLNELIVLFGQHNVHVMALTTLDTVDSAILRVVVDDPVSARQLLQKEGLSFSETDLLAVELKTLNDLKHVLAALLEAEINIRYLYPFIFRPAERAALAMNIEDMDLAADALQKRGFRVLNQSDISR